MSACATVEFQPVSRDGICEVTRPGAMAVLPRKWLTFRLGAVEYGIDILRVQEIRGYERCTQIANSPAFVKGVVNLRGVIVPILDLRLKFRLERAEYDAFTVTVILNVGQRVVGVVVDAVCDVVQLTREQIKAPPEFNSVIENGFMTGIGTLEQGERHRMLMLLDIEQMIFNADMGLFGSNSHQHH